MITTFDLVYWLTAAFLLGILILAGTACAIYIFSATDEPEPEAEEPPSAFAVAINEHLASRERVS